jgi:hypothetical protein
VVTSTDFDVVPGSAASLQLADVPVGELTLSAHAFGAACAGIAGTQATWAGSGVAVTVRAGEVTPAALTLEPVGGIDVGIGFGSDGGADMGAPADMATPADMTAPADMTPSCAAGFLLCDGRCVDPSSDAQNCGACGQVCASGRCGRTFGSDRPGDWFFNGSATAHGASATFQLTPFAQNQAGTAIYRQPIRTGDFEVSFTFRITPALESFPADGLAFMIEKDGPTAVGAPGSGMGVAGLSGYGVEFDPYNNVNPSTGGGGCGDVSFNHTSVDSLDVCRDYNGNALPTTLAASGQNVFHADGQLHLCHVRVADGRANVTVDGIDQLLGVPLPGFTRGETYYFGFGAGTGMSYAQHEVTSVQVMLPTAQCL